MSEEKESGQINRASLASLSVEGVDLVEGDRLYKETYPEILRCYCHDVDEQLDVIDELYSGTLDEDALKKYATAVHGIKGSSFGIQANGMGKLAEYMEHTAKAGDMEAILANHVPFTKKAVGLVLSLRELLKTIEPQSQKSMAKKPDQALLNKIAEVCGNFNFTEMEKALAELEKYEYESGNDLIIWLREQVDNLEYDKIRERLLSI
jgi:chemotaxis protein histidine kinase CheA